MRISDWSSDVCSSDLWPQFEPSVFADETRLPAIAQQLLAPLFAGDALAAALPQICEQALDIDAPLRALPSANTWLLELFHGPTAAFKAFAARFLSACFLALETGRASFRESGCQYD